MKSDKVVLLFLLGWMGLIFYFSSQTYEEQSLLPLLESSIENAQVEESIRAANVSVTYAGSEISVETKGTSDFIEFFIRKAAHFFIFFVLGMLAFVYAVLVWKKRLLSSVISFIFVIVYAALDEYHQLLTGGRTPLWQDVVLDSAGGLFGILVCVVFMFVREQIFSKVKTPVIS